MRFLSPAERIQWDDQFDLISIGSGLAGMATTITASELGMRALVLEKSNKIGGTTSWSSGIVWVGNSHLGPRQRRDGLCRRKPRLSRLSRGRT